MRILITGGAGFIGSHLAERLNSEGHEVTIIDRRPWGDSLESAISRGIRYDLRNEEWRYLYDNVDFVYHLAATVGVKNVLADPKECIENNVESLRAVLALGIPGIYASTSEVYGKTDGALAEDSDLLYSSKARWSYAASKLVGEWLAKSAGWKTVRFFNVVGPRQSSDYGAVLPSFVGQAFRGDPITVHGNGCQLRTFMDVRDTVEILDKLRDQDFDVVNVGSNHTVSIFALAHMVKRVLGSKSEIKFESYEKAFGPEFEECPARVPDLKKLNSLIGYMSYRDLEQTIRELANSMKEQQYVSVG